MKKITQNVNKCTACYACQNICPKNCIEFNINEYGELLPIINEDHCSGCGSCVKVCPANNPRELQVPLKVYAAYSKKNENHLLGASGGVASVLSEEFLNFGGSVYGCEIKSDLSFKFSRIDTPQDVSRFRGSKYVHSIVDDCFSDVKDNLINGRKVLFIGLPCQVAGLKNFLNVDYSNLITIDLICHGVPSLQTFIEYLKMEDIEIETISKITFRDKLDGFTIKIFDKHENLIGKFYLRSSLYYVGFIKSYIYRENCYYCPYAKQDRIGDLTLGDFWGLGTTIPFEGDKKNGINLVLINSLKGEKIWENVQSNIICYERTLEEAVAGNEQLRHPAKKTKVHDKFRKLYKEKGCSYALSHCSYRDWAIISFKKVLRNERHLFYLIQKIPFIRSKF